MAPRTEEDSTMMVTNTKSNTPDREVSFSEFESIAFLHEKHTLLNPSDFEPVPSDPAWMDRLPERLTEVNSRFLARKHSLQKQIDCYDKTSCLVRSCEWSLGSTLSSMMDQMRPSNDTIQDGTTNPWRALLAVRGISSYLDIIQVVLSHPQRTSLEEGLLKINKEIQSRLEGAMGASEKTTLGNNSTPMSDCGMFVSPWTIPRVAFDVTVGVPVLTDTRTRMEMQKKRAHVTGMGSSIDGQELPLKAQVQAVTDLGVDEILEDRYSLPTCKIEVERCVHRACAHCPGKGDVILLVALQPTEEDFFSKFRVKEARMTQANAVPPLFHASVDLFTSLSDGDNKAKVTLRLPTRTMTIDNQVAEIKVELLVGLT